MDEAGARKRSIGELKLRLARLDAAGDKAEFAKRLAGQQLLGVFEFFTFYNAQDQKDSGQVIAFVDEGVSRFPDRDYYLKEDAKSREIRARYLKHIEKIMRLAGESRARRGAAAETVLRLETVLARASLPLDDRRDTQKTFHPMDVAGLKALVPAFDWDAYFPRSASPRPRS